MQARDFDTCSGSTSELNKRNITSRYRWNSVWEYMTFSMACTFSTLNFCAMIINPTYHDDANIIQYVTAYIFIGLPIYYMQTVIGQYTQLGIIFFKYLTPIGHGVSYSYILNLMIRSIDRGLELADFFEYLLTSMQLTLQWTQCPEDTKIKCWSGSSNCTSNCLKGAQISALIYYKITYLDNPDETVKKVVYTMPPLKKIIPILFVWFLTVILLIYAIFNYKKITKVLLASVLILVSSLFANFVLLNGIEYCLQQIFQLHTRNWTDFYSWCMAIGNTIRLLALGRAFHILSGSYLHPTASSGILSVSTVTVNFLLNVLCIAITYTCFGIIIRFAHMKDYEMNYVSHEKFIITMTIIPQVMEFAGIPQLWSAVYFISCILLLLANQVTHLMAIEKAICDTYPPLFQYRKYVVSLLCLFCVITGVFLVSREVDPILSCLKRAVHFAELFNVMAMCIMVCWVYGVQRLCDDIHFLSGSQPTKFWKICWYILPILTIVTYFTIIYNILMPEVYSNRITTYVFFMVFISPVPILAIIEIFRFIRKRNLVGLFKPEERYGPPDPEDRYSRIIYNPRKEIRSRRRNDSCHHRCLLSSRILQRLMQEELSNEGGVSNLCERSLSL